MNGSIVWYFASPIRTCISGGGKPSVTISNSISIAAASSGKTGDLRKSTFTPGQPRDTPKSTSMAPPSATAALTPPHGRTDDTGAQSTAPHPSGDISADMPATTGVPFEFAEMSIEAITFSGYGFTHLATHNPRLSRPIHPGQQSTDSGRVEGIPSIATSPKSTYAFAGNSCLEPSA